LIEPKLSDRNVSVTPLIMVLVKAVGEPDAFQRSVFLVPQEESQGVVLNSIHSSVCCDERFPALALFWRILFMHLDRGLDNGIHRPEFYSLDIAEFMQVMLISFSIATL